MVSELLAISEQHRETALSSLDKKMQDELGQFFTPAPAATLIASMPRLPEGGVVRVLDPGAGSGMLSAALVARVLGERQDLAVHVVAVERDQCLLPHLRATLDECKAAGDGKVTAEIIEDDFLMLGRRPDAERLGGFDLVVQNPPYGKLAASSPHRRAVKESLVDAPNLYAAFLALAAAALRPGGQLVAITPRSFFNGPYFGSFRSFFLDHVALDRVHVFDSRSTVFADTGVLQENVIFSGTRGGAADLVALSISKGHTDDVVTRAVPYAEVVHPNDPHRFIRLATAAEDTKVAETMMSLPCTLTDLGVKASTGKVVDFRSRDALRSQADQGGVPLIYPGNLRSGAVEWPRAIGKAQWFVPTALKDQALVIPEGWYAVVKRFSAKEEKRRIVASVWSPERYPGPVAFENHLNVFHINGEGLDADLAMGLTCWLNSTFVDRFFRTFSGHTQVNATDLRTLRFPPVEHLRALGEHAGGDQGAIDAAAATVLSDLKLLA